ncbi:hypothetical protein CHUAL_011418, partial [Chamberlinius hualienensis]
CNTGLKEMTSRVTYSLKKFRKKFTLPLSNINWFPGHMAKGVKQMQQKLKSVDCIIEVHDARIPFSGRNPNFYHMLTAIRPHILVLNKMDLSNLRLKHDILDTLKEKYNDTNVIFTDCRSEAGISSILSKVLEQINLSDRFNRAENPFYSVMTIGVPNVGKSSVINALRNYYLNRGNATRVGPTPGVTRSVLEKIRICDDPVVYLLDTPGVLEPNIKNIEIGMKLALCAVIEDHTVGTSLVADYLLYWMNKHQNFNYVDFLNLKEPNDNINEVLMHIAATRKLIISVASLDGTMRRHPDFDEASLYLLRAFRDGKLGRFMFDVDDLKK